MKNMFLIAFSLMIVATVQAQKPVSKSAGNNKPKLVVGLVIDQMRWDYLHRFADRYSDRGFKRLMNDGFNCNNTFINYTPTQTAVGHATLYTGSVPAIHSIMGNSWYSRDLKRTVYCTDDSTVAGVGTTSNAGKMSPVNLHSTTIGDEQRLATNFRSKVIAIGLKDRGSILPGGHSANAAYWFDYSIGEFISSTYYMNELPAWVQHFNSKRLPDLYLKQNWNTLYPINTYKQSTIDAQAYEIMVPGEDNTFPHITDNITSNKYNSFRYTPHGNTYAFDMARAAIEGEQLGRGQFTDILALSCSSTDLVGHEFGPNSIEVEDMYLRLDKDIASFLDYLDKTIGKDQYTMFLSSDHGVSENSTFLRQNKIPSAVNSSRIIEARLNKVLQSQFNIANGISRIMNYQVYLNHAALQGQDEQAIYNALTKELLSIPVVSNAYILKNVATSTMPKTLKESLTNGYNQKLSGDIQYILRPNSFDGSDKGSTHGLWHNYDSHIPLIFYGWGIKKGSTNRRTNMTDVAATLAALLKVQMPSGCIGDVIEEVMK